MNVLEVVLSIVAVALTALGIAFAMWGRKVDDLKGAALSVADSIREVVAVKLGVMADDVHEIKGDVKDLARTMHENDLRIAVLEVKAKTERENK